MAGHIMNRMGLPVYRPDGQGGGDDAAEDYLSKLAQSVLKKEVRPLVPPAVGATPITPRPVPRNIAPSSPPLRREEPTSGSREWVRKIDFFNEQGNFLPGTILVFEDGSMGVFKETNAAKDYDIVYQLAETGRAIPQGMPLYTYTVEPVGRLSQAVLDQIIATNKWERDMIVFHLVKYKDRVHIPAHKARAQDTPDMNETLSSWTVPKLPSHEPRAEPQPEKPALIRGRRLTIEFGPQQKWDAVYWGKDELGHVVAHNTHEQWSIMHLDLNRFKDSIVFGELVPQDVIAKMEKDFTKG